MGSSRTRAQTRVPCSGRQILNHWATEEVPPSPFINWKSTVGRALPSSWGCFYQSFCSEGKGGSRRMWRLDPGLACLQSCGLGIRRRKEDPLGIAGGDLISQAWRSTPHCIFCQLPCTTPGESFSILRFSSPSPGLIITTTMDALYGNLLDGCHTPYGSGLLLNPFYKGGNWGLYRERRWASSLGTPESQH